MFKKIQKIIPGLHNFIEGNYEVSDYLAVFKVVHLFLIFRCIYVYNIPSRLRLT